MQLASRPGVLCAINNQKYLVVHIRYVDTSRIDDHKRSIEVPQDQRARIDYAIELHMAELHALGAKGCYEGK